MSVNTNPAQKEALQYEDEKVWHDDELKSGGCLPVLLGYLGIKWPSVGVPLTDFDEELPPEDDAMRVG